MRSSGRRGQRTALRVSDEKGEDMQIIDETEALDLLRRAIGPEWGGLKRFAEKVGVSVDLLDKIRYRGAPITGAVARRLRLQRLWDENRYVWIPRNVNSTLKGR